MKKIAFYLMILAIPVAFFALTCLAGEFVMRCVCTSFRQNYDEAMHFNYDATTKRGDFRKGNVIPVKMPGTFRILALGDSFTWGVSVRNTADLWTSVLEEDLNTLSPKRIEVLNMGKEAFTTFNEYELLERYGWAQEPDLLIVQFNLNDPLPSLREFVRPTAPENVLNIHDLIPFRAAHDYLVRHSYFYILLNGKFHDVQLAIFHPYYHRELYRDDYIGWRQCKAALALIRKQAAEHNVKVILVVFPEFIPGVHTRETYVYTDLHEKIDAIGASLNFHVVDLLDAFIAQKKDFRYWHALKLDPHPNAAAHRLAAEQIAECIMNDHLIGG